MYTICKNMVTSVVSTISRNIQTHLSHLLLRPHFLQIIIVLLFTLFVIVQPVGAIEKANTFLTQESPMPWWVWPVGLFIFTFCLGIVAVIGGIGGGVLFVPIVGSFFPFHLDFVRATGLLMALSGAVAAGPELLKKGFADLRFAIPIALIASSSAIIGALIGLALPANYIQFMLGATILVIVAILLRAKKSDFPDVQKPDFLSSALQIHGIYYEECNKKEIPWQIHNTPQGLFVFVFIGLLAGIFGIGAGWANVPVLNLLMGAPLKVSVATSTFLLSITDTSAAWIYITNGAVVPLIVLPSLIGIMLGSRVGVKLLTRCNPKQIRLLVIGILLFSGLRSILKAFGI